jgi:hypothetical protein
MITESRGAIAAPRPPEAHAWYLEDGPKLSAQARHDPQSQLDRAVRLDGQLGTLVACRLILGADQDDLGRACLAPGGLPGRMLVTAIGFQVMLGMPERPSAEGEVWSTLRAGRPPVGQGGATAHLGMALEPESIATLTGPLVGDLSVEDRDPLSDGLDLIRERPQMEPVAFLGSTEFAVQADADGIELAGVDAESPLEAPLEIIERFAPPQRRCQGAFGLSGDDTGVVEVGPQLRWARGLIGRDHRSVTGERGNGHAYAIMVGPAASGQALAADMQRSGPVIGEGDYPTSRL